MKEHDYLLILVTEFLGRVDGAVEDGNYYSARKYSKKLLETINDLIIYSDDEDIEL